MDFNTQQAPDKGLMGILRRYIADIIYGANDGIVTTFCVVAGVKGAKLAPLVIIILGVVNLLGDGVSMGASSYLSARVSAATKGVSGYSDPMLHGLVTFLAFIICGAVPLISFVLMPDFSEHQFLISCMLTALTLFLVGSLRVFIVGKGWFKAGLEMLTVGGIAAIIAYGVGHILAQALGETYQGILN